MRVGDPDVWGLGLEFVRVGGSLCMRVGDPCVMRVGDPCV